MQFPQTDWAQMLILEDCFFVVIGSIHEASVEDAMLHGEGVAKLMVYYFAQECHICLRLIFFPLYSLLAISFFDYLLKRNYTGSIFDGSQAKHPLLFYSLYRITTILYAQICDDSDRVGILGQMLCKICVHLCCIVVLLPILTHHWVELLQIYFPELVELHLHPIEECLCSTLHQCQGFLGEVGKKSANVYNLLRYVDVVSTPRCEQPESLPVFFEFVEVIPWLWGFDGLEVIEDSLQRLLDLPLLPSQRAKRTHPLFLIRHHKGNDSRAIPQRIDPLYFFLALHLHDLNF